MSTGSRVAIDRSIVVSPERLGLKKVAVPGVLKRLGFGSLSSLLLLGLASRCKNQAKCLFCGDSHATILYYRSICDRIGRSCNHTLTKYSNYNRSHFADSRECEVLISTLKSKASQTSK